MESELADNQGNPPSESGEERHKTLKDLSEDERPREKMKALGVENLTSSELLAILVHTGTTKKTVIQICEELLQKANNNIRDLYDMSLEEMMEVNGIGEAKAITIKAALELGHKVNLKANTQKLSGSSDFFEYLRSDLEFLDCEELWIVALRSNLSVIKKEMVSRGGITQTPFDVRLIMRRLLELKATGVVMAHNHPSGSLKPSNQDKEITKTLKAACDLMGIHMYDHIIIGAGEYYSFFDNLQLG